MGATHLENCEVIVVTIQPFSGKETKRMAVPDPSSYVFYHFTTKYEDLEREYTWDNLIKIGLLPSN